MYAKVVQPRGRSSKVSNSFKRLVTYITSTNGHTERLGQIIVLNYGHEFGSIEGQKERLVVAHRAGLAGLIQQEMIDKIRPANSQKESRDKSYHLVVGFPLGEHPSTQQIEMMSSRFIKELGFDQHLVVGAVHHDTDTTHLHLAINRVHPERLTLHAPFNDYRVLERVCRELEHELGLTVVQAQSSARARDLEMEREKEERAVGGIVEPRAAQEKGPDRGADTEATAKDHLQTADEGNALSPTFDESFDAAGRQAEPSDEQFDSAPTGRSELVGGEPGEAMHEAPLKPSGELDRSDVPRSPPGLEGLEYHGMLEGLITFVRKNLPAAKELSSWAALHAAAAGIGVEYVTSGQGAAFRCNGLYCKASSVSRAFGRKRLEERWGPFQQRDIQEELSPRLSYRPRPVMGQSPVSLRTAEQKALWKAYTQLRDDEYDLASAADRLRVEGRTKDEWEAYKFLKTLERAFDRKPGRPTFGSVLKTLGVKQNPAALALLRQNRRAEERGLRLVPKRAQRRESTFETPPLSCTGWGTLVFEQGARFDGSAIVVRNPARTEQVSVALRLAGEAFTAGYAVEGQPEDVRVFEESVRFIAPQSGDRSQDSVEVFDQGIAEERESGKEDVPAPVLEYSNERNEKRELGVQDVKEHVACPFDFEGEGVYRGLRFKKGLTMALVEQDDQMLVVPIRPAMIRTARGWKRGQMLQLGAGKGQEDKDDR